MNPVSFQGRRVTVAGLGRFGGGLAVARWLVQQGARVLVTDQADPASLKDSVEQLAGLPIEFRLGEHRKEDFQDTDLVVASPAIPPRSEHLQAARDAGVPITTEIRLFIERCPAPIIGVTGTKGKSTTTTLLGLMLKSRFPTHVGGNIGGSLLAELPAIQPEHLVVLELSSFMLEYLADDQWSPHVALVTMIAEDHLDRHETFDNYRGVKQNIVRFQTASDFAVVCESCPYAHEFIALAPGKVILYGLKDRKLFSLKIPGEHNQLNAQAAFAAASLFDVSFDEAQEAVAGFCGLPHRLQLVHEHRGVRYYNDSIATIPQAAVAALRSFPPRTVIQIVGGYDKHLPLTDMCAELADRAKSILCIGKTGDAIADTLQGIGGATVYRCGDLATAMSIARQQAVAGDVVLLSTGCASYDQFRNFQERGEVFTRLARA